MSICSDYLPKNKSRDPHKKRKLSLTTIQLVVN